MRYFFLFIFILSFFLFPTPTYAHVLKEDGSIGALLHIHPNDEPIAREKSEFFLNLKDKNNKFSSDICDCTVAILESGKELYSQPLFQESEKPVTSTTFTYTFPKEAVYIVRITGKPLEPNAFQSFTLDYPVRVAQIASDNEEKPTQTSFAPYVVGLLLGSSVVILFVRKKIKKK